MSLNSNTRSSRKAKILPQFSISSGHKPLLDLLEIQRKSFFHLLEYGIPHELAKTNIFRETAKNSTFTPELELKFNPETYKFISPNCTPKQAILNGKTYACKVYVQATLVIRSSSQVQERSLNQKNESFKSTLQQLNTRIDFLTEDTNYKTPKPAIPEKLSKIFSSNMEVQSIDSVDNKSSNLVATTLNPSTVSTSVQNQALQPMTERHKLMPEVYTGLQKNKNFFLPINSYANQIRESNFATNNFINSIDSTLPYLVFYKSKICANDTKSSNSIDFVDNKSSNFVATSFAKQSFATATSSYEYKRKYTQGKLNLVRYISNRIEHMGSPLLLVKTRHRLCQKNFYFDIKFQESLVQLTTGLSTKLIDINIFFNLSTCLIINPFFVKLSTTSSNNHWKTIFTYTSICRNVTIFYPWTPYFVPFLELCNSYPFSFVDIEEANKTILSSVNSEDVRSLGGNINQIDRKENGLVNLVQRKKKATELLIASRPKKEVVLHPFAKQISQDLIQIEEGNVLSNSEKKSSIKKERRIWCSSQFRQPWYQSSQSVIIKKNGLPCSLFNTHAKRSFAAKIAGTGNLVLKTFFSGNKCEISKLSRNDLLALFDNKRASLKEKRQYVYAKSIRRKNHALPRFVDSCFNFTGSNDSDASLSSVAKRNYAKKLIDSSAGLSVIDEVDRLRVIGRKAKLCEEVDKLPSSLVTSEDARDINGVDKLLGVQIFRPWIFLGELPLMTKRGHFILNGSPRVIVNQIARCPGIYFQEKRRGVGFEQEIRVSADLIPQRGPWLRIQSDWEGRFWARLKQEGRIKYATLYEAFQESEKEYNSPLICLLTNSNSSSPFSKSETVSFQERKTKEERQKKALIRLFKNTSRYSLGKLGRFRVNERIHSYASLPLSESIRLRQNFSLSNLDPLLKNSLKKLIQSIDFVNYKSNKLAATVPTLPTVSISSIMPLQSAALQPRTAKRIGLPVRQASLKIQEARKLFPMQSNYFVGQNAKIRQRSKPKAAVNVIDRFISGKIAKLPRFASSGYTNPRFVKNRRGERGVDKTSESFEKKSVNKLVSENEFSALHIFPPKNNQIDFLSTELIDLKRNLSTVSTPVQSEALQPIVPVQSEALQPITNSLLMAKDIDAIHTCLERLLEGQGFTDDIDHLKNRFIRTSGKLLQQQFELGLHRLNEVIMPLLSNLLHSHLDSLEAIKENKGKRKNSNVLVTKSAPSTDSFKKEKSSITLKKFGTKTPETIGKAKNYSPSFRYSVDNKSSNSVATSKKINTVNINKVAGVIGSEASEQTVDNLLEGEAKCGTLSSITDAKRSFASRQLQKNLSINLVDNSTGLALRDGSSNIVLDKINSSKKLPKSVNFFSSTNEISCKKKVLKREICKVPNFQALNFFEKQNITPSVSTWFLTSKRGSLSTVSTPVQSEALQPITESPSVRRSSFYPLEKENKQVIPTFRYSRRVSSDIYTSNHYLAGEAQDAYQKDLLSTKLIEKNEAQENKNLDLSTLSRLNSNVIVGPPTELSRSKSKKWNHFLSYNFSANKFSVFQQAKRWNSFYPQSINVVENHLLGNANKSLNSINQSTSLQSEALQPMTERQIDNRIDGIDSVDSALLHAGNSEAWESSLSASSIKDGQANFPKERGVRKEDKNKNINKVDKKLLSSSLKRKENKRGILAEIAPFRWLRTSKPINSAFREFFGSNPLSQYMDQTNPLAEITHKRRLSSMGPGGIKRETAGMEVRGIHPTHYGRVCPIETPEGKNAGLVNSPTVYGRVSSYGFLETPLYQVIENQVQMKRWAFFSAQQEENEKSSLATCDTGLLRFNFLAHGPIPVQTANNPLAHFQQVERNRVGYRALSPVQTISIATALIPFLEHDDANRALMGSNMQRQAIPLLSPERPIVGTGFEPLVVVESGQALQATKLGCVSHVNAKTIVMHTIQSMGSALPQNSLRNAIDNLSTLSTVASSSLVPRSHVRFFTKRGSSNGVARFVQTILNVSTSVQSEALQPITPAQNAVLQPIRYTAFVMKKPTGHSISKTYHRFFNIIKNQRTNQALQPIPIGLAKRWSLFLARQLWRKKKHEIQGSVSNKFKIGEYVIDKLTNVELLWYVKKLLWNTPQIYSFFPANNFCSTDNGNYENLSIVSTPSIVPMQREALQPMTECQKRVFLEGFSNIYQHGTPTIHYLLSKIRRESDKISNLPTKSIGTRRNIGTERPYQSFTSSKQLVKCDTKEVATELLDLLSLPNKESIENSLRIVSTPVQSEALQPITHSQYNEVATELLDLLSTKSIDFGSGKKSQVLDISKKIPNLTKTRLHLCSSHKTFFLQPIKQDLQLYQRSNQETCLNQRPLVQEGDWIQKGDFLADSSASNFGDLALGKNVTVAYMPWEGYNFEDAIVISDRLVSDDIYTSLHIERYEIKVNKNSQGKERITNRVPGTSHSLKHLDNLGIARISSWVQPGDILVGKVVELKRPLSPYERLAWELASRLSPASPEREKWLNKVWLEDISLRLPPGICGRVINSQIVATEWSEKEQVVYPQEVHIYLAVKRKIQIGDKLAGRHGNKGIVSAILPQQDMPYMGDGSCVDMVLNPLGVPSRMNLGQIFECLLGLAGSQLGCNFKITPFDEIAGGEASRSLVFLKLYQCRLIYKQQWLFTPTFPGKNKLFDGRTGEPFENWVTVGKAYMLKLIHMVDHKIHARSTGPYSLFTRQPVRGRSRRGGQRLGEMEVWAVEGFGAAYTLQEFLTIKSDDLKARTALQKGFYKQNDVTFGKIHISPGNPEAFKVLVSELQALCLHIQM